MVPRALDRWRLRRVLPTKNADHNRPRSSVFRNRGGGDDDPTTARGKPDVMTDGKRNGRRPPRVAQISADMRNFIHVNNYVLKAEHTPDLDPIVAAKLRAAAGLVHLDQKEYAKVGGGSACMACMRFWYLTSIPTGWALEGASLSRPEFFEGVDLVLWFVHRKVVRVPAVGLRRTGGEPPREIKSQRTRPTGRLRARGGRDPAAHT